MFDRETAKIYSLHAIPWRWLNNIAVKQMTASYVIQTRPWSHCVPLVNKSIRLHLSVKLLNIYRGGGDGGYWHLQLLVNAGWLDDLQNKEKMYKQQL